MMRSHEASQFFIVGHTILAIALGVLSLAGGFCLLTGKRRQDSTQSGT
jgi:hypothetical protein